MKDRHFVSRIFICSGALMCISGILIAICVKVAYGGILFAVSACMFAAARTVRIAEDKQEKEDGGSENEQKPE